VSVGHGHDHGHDHVLRLVEDDTARGVHHAVTTRRSAGVLAALIARAARVDRLEPWDQDSFHTELGIDTLPPHITVPTVTTRHGPARPAANRS
jgi:hypothetical protein